MSVIATKTRKDLEFATTTRPHHAPVISAISFAAGVARNAIVKCARLMAHAAEAIAEARMQRAKIEAELYRNRYRHRSKNDDDLPIVR